MFVSSLETCRRVLGESHFQTSVAKAGMARCHLAAKRFEEAEKLALENYQFMSTNFGAHGAVTLRAVEILRDVYQGWGKSDQAALWTAKLAPPPAP